MPFDQSNPLERATSVEGLKESRRANAAFRDYARMGAVRSLRDLVAQYKLNPETAPSTKWSTVTTWSAKFAWVERAKVFESIQQAKDQEAYEARRREIMESGLALTHERISKLNRLFEKLEGYLSDEDKVWLPDVKLIGAGGGGKSERVDIVRFNAALIEHFRGTLDDIAREMGQRMKPEKDIMQNIDLSTLSINQLKRLRDGENVISVLANPD